MKKENLSVRISIFALMCVLSAISNAEIGKDAKISISTGPITATPKESPKEELDKRIMDLAIAYETNPAAVDFEKSAQELIAQYTTLYNPQFGSWFTQRQRQIDILNRIIELYKDKKDALEKVVSKFQNMSQEWTADFTQRNMNVPK